MKKKFRLKRVSVPQPIIAVLGGKHFTDYLPNDISNIAPLKKENEKVNTEGIVSLTRNKRIVKKTERQTKMLGRY